MEAEGSNSDYELETLRKAIVLGQSGSSMYEAILPVGHGRAIRIPMNHYYGALKISNFR